MADPKKIGAKITSAIKAAGEEADAALAAKKAGKTKEILESKQAPMTTPQGTGLPLMPRSQGMYTPGITQRDLPRMPKVDKARAAGESPQYTPRMQDLLESATARKKVNSLIQKGEELGMREWYGTEPLRQVAMDIGLSPEEFRAFMAQMASASQRNPVDKQNQMGSYLWHLSRTGQLPEDAFLMTNKIRSGKAQAPEGTPIALPAGYGSLAQGDIFERAKQISSGDILGALPPERKLGTFYENLLGNVKPVTVDVNAVRGPVIERGDPRWLTSKLVEKDEEGKVIATYFPRKMYESGELSLKQAKERPGFWEAAPSGSEYAGFEDLWQRAAKRHDIAPAEAQALGWYGSADVTALKTKPELYVDNLERLIRRTAEQTGRSPTQVMHDMLTGQGFLRKEGGAIDEDAMHKRLKEKIDQMEKGHVRLAHRSLRKASGGAVGGPVGQTDDNTMPDLSDGGQTLYAPKYDVGGGVSKVSRAVGKATKEAESILAARRGQQAVLPAAESAANLEKMLAQSKEKRRMYHGTYRKPQVIHKQTGTEKPLTEYDWQGNVVTAKPMPEIPEEGLTSIMPGQRRGMIFVSPDPEFASFYARGPSGGAHPLEGGQMYPVRVHTKNPFDYENPDHVKAVVDAMRYGKQATPLSIAQDATREDMLHALRTGDWPYIEDPEVLNTIRRLGFDGAYMRESNTKNLGVFRPEQVKSDIGNRGTYDITDPDMTKADGGQVQLEMAGGGISKISKAIAKATEEAEAIAPAVNRIDMNYKDVTKRVPELTEAAQKVARGEMSPIEYDRIVNQFKPVMPYGFVPQPATYDDAMRALNEAKRPMFGKAGEIATGEQTDLRLDIPAYKDHGVWVNSIHRKDAPTVYGSVSAVKNATMIGSPDKAMKVATGETAKAPFAVIRGEWNPMDEQTAVKNAQKYLKHKDWRQVGYDPERHGYFYDRTTMEPILGAEEVIQIGPLVLAKKPRYGAKAEQKFDEGGAATMNPMLARQGAKWRQTHDYNPERQELIGQILARKAKEQALEEVESLKKPGAAKDLLVKGVGAGLLGMPSDLINLGLQGVDFMVSDAGRKPVGFQLGSDRPFLGSEHLKELAQEYGLASETERPMMETGLSLINPGALVGAVKAAPKAVRAGESALNTAAAAARRPFTPATLTVEAVAPDLAKNLPREWQQTVTRSLTGEGAPVSMDVMGGRKTVKRPGQGVYENFAGDLETNPLVAVDVPRAGSLSGNKALRADIATAGQELAQESMAAHRFVPMATNQIKDASAMLIRTPEGLTNEQVIALGERLPGMIVAHNPRLGGVVVMPFEYSKGQIPGEFLDAQAVAHELLGKQANFRYGKADPVRDRLYMERQDYLTEGARPPSAAATEMRARLKQGERRMFPAPSQSSTRRRGALESAATTAH